MKDVEYFYFMLPPSIWKKKPHRSSFKMDAEHAAKAYPGATPILDTREIRTLPDTEEEIRAAMLVTQPGYSGFDSTEEAIGRRIQAGNQRMKEQGELP
ncbi:hypothetical protein [Variovorax sp. 278MFTsu5.1]|uniref:hypothetical protein n=1 Tax=Variovorax sp. 278MFTsu5.1 TaxID=3158366 RepID=UPI003AAE6DF0